VKNADLILNFTTGMPLTKEQKGKILEELKENIAKQKSMIFVAIDKLKVKDTFGLRQQLKKVGARLAVAKKTLTRIALKEKGIEIDFKKLLGEAGIVFGFNDETSSAKVAYDFSRTNPELKLLGGFVENKLLTTEEVIALAQIPSRDGLLGQLVGLFASPIRGLETVLQGNIRGLVSVLGQIKK